MCMRYTKLSTQEKNMYKMSFDMGSSYKTSGPLTLQITTEKNYVQTDLLTVGLIFFFSLHVLF